MDLGFMSIGRSKRRRLAGLVAAVTLSTSFAACGSDNSKETYARGLNKACVSLGTAQTSLQKSLAPAVDSLTRGETSSAKTVIAAIDLYLKQFSQQAKALSDLKPPSQWKSFDDQLSKQLQQTQNSFAGLGKAMVSSDKKVLQTALSDLSKLQAAAALKTPEDLIKAAPACSSLGA